MGLETGTYISQLNSSYPASGDDVSEGDDHLKLIKAVLKNQFSGLSGTTAISASEAELNLMDGVTATTAELNILDGVTSTYAELNILDGVTSTPAELNTLDVTTQGTSEASKVLTADSNGDVTIADGAYDFDVASHDGTNGLKLGGTLVTATATELNLIDGYTGTTAELNYNDVTTLGTVENSKAVTADASGVVNHVDKIVQRPEFKDYGETVNAIGNTGGGSQSIDLLLGNVVTATQTASATTYTFDNPSDSGSCCSFTLILTNGASNSGTVWPGAVDWASGTEPTLTSSGIDILTFTTVDGGTIWYGFAAGTDMQSP